MQSLEASISTRMAKYLQKCINSGSPEGYAKCALEDEEKLEKQRELFGFRMMFMTRTLSDCLATAKDGGNSCKDQAINIGSQNIGDFKKFFEKI